MKQIEKFYEEMTENETLQKEIEALNKEFEGAVMDSKEMRQKVADQLSHIAQKYGIQLTAEDILNENAGQLSDDDLDAVAGGTECYCVIGGGGEGGKSSKGTDEICGCVLAGFGNDSINEGDFRCVCALYGSGHSDML